MESFTCLLTFILLLPLKTLGKQPYIVNGTIASIKNNRFLCAVLIKDGNKEYFKGGAAIVGLYWAITAASVIDFAPESEIKAGLLSIRSNSEIWKRGRKHVVTYVYKHPEYSPITYDHDLAFMKVKASFNGRNEKAVKLAGSRYKEEKYAYIFGWGTEFFYDNSVMKKLKQTVIVVVNSTVCKKKFSSTVFGRRIATSMMCTINDGTGDCYGDGGGPVVQHHDILIGVISWGRTCGKADFPSVLTSISKETRFIETMDVNFRIGLTYKNFV